jgi:hypothetical protein
MAFALAASACQPEPRLSPQPSPAAAASPPSSTASGAPRATQPVEPDLASIEIHLLDPRFAPADAPVSTGGAIVWASTPDGRFPSELWRYVPGSAEPELLFASPRERSRITTVAGSESGYAFVEVNRPEFGEGGWRVWYLAGPGAEPVELDRGVAKWAKAMPTLAMDDDRIAWAGFDEPVGATFEEALDHAVTRLAIATVANPSHPTTLLELPVHDSLLWYPTLHGDELWYGVIIPHNEESGLADHYHVETIDLANTGDPPSRFEGLGNDFNPVATDSFVVWKANRIGDAPLNWGSIKVLDRATQALRTIPVQYANRPSVGDRFITFSELFGTSLPLYDPLTGTLLDLAAQVPDGAGDGALYFAESVNGRLFTFGVGQRIGWAILPE